MPNNANVAKSILTDNFANAGLLPPETADYFLGEVYEATPLSKLIRHEKRVSPTGYIDKLGIDSRIIRRKYENYDDGERAGVHTDRMGYTCVPVRLVWEISGETLRQNIEQEKLESKITALMTGQIGRDLEDLSVNGDESTSSSDPDYKFLSLNNGFKKLITSGGTTYNVGSINGGAMSIDTFMKGAMKLDPKYLNEKMRWLMSPRRKMEWERVLHAQGITVGGFAPDKFYESPASYPIVEVPRLDDSTVLLTDPQNLVQVNTYNVSVQSDKTSVIALAKDMAYYVVHLDVDFIIEELAATLAITNLAAIN